LVLEGCRVRAKKLSTDRHNIVSLLLNVQKAMLSLQKMQALTSQRPRPSRTKDCHLINRIFRNEKSPQANSNFGWFRASTLS